MTEEEEQKRIKNVINFLQLTDWRISPEAKKYFCYYHGYLFLKAKNNKLYLFNICCPCSLDFKHFFPKNKKLALETSLLSIDDYLHQIFKKRVGIKGYKGYFKIIDILPYQE